MELSKEQQRVVDATEPVVFVRSAASSGKTRMLVEKIRQSIERHKTVVAFTFTNMASAEMRARLHIDKNTDEIFVGTIHGYCARLLLSAGKMKAKKYLEDGEFDKLFELIKEYPECAKPVDICLCDEAQDTSADQFNFMFDIIRAKEYFVVYDLRQSIYRWRDARPDLLKYYGKELGATVYELNENYRCGSSILDFARRIILKTGLSDRSIAMRPVRGVAERKILDPKELAEQIKSNPNYKDWAILTRSNAQIWEIASYLKLYGIPYDTFKQGDLDKDELDIRMEQNTVKVLTIHASKGLEFRFVGVYGAHLWSDEDYCLGYVAVTRARDRLIWYTSIKKKKTFSE